MDLTAIQLRVLHHLADAEERAQVPTFRELMTTFGWTSIGSVQTHIRTLGAKGLLLAEPRKARSLRLTSLGRRVLATGAGDETQPNGTFASTALEMMEILTPWLRRRAYGKGANLWSEGDRADRLVIVDEGHLRAFRLLPDGRRVTVLQFGPGDVLGFAPFFDEGGYPASVETMDPVKIRFVVRQDLIKAIREPRVAMTLFRFLARRLRRAFDTIEQFSRHRALPRVAAALQALVHGKDFQILTLPHSSKAFAETVGLAPATLSRTLAHLVRMGILHRLGPRRYQVLLGAELARLAEGEPD